MIYDYRTLGATLDVEEAQLNEGGANAWDNCEPATLALIAKWYGNGDPYEPQSITDAVYGASYHGGEMIERLNPWFKSHYKYWPDMITVDNRDVIDGTRLAAKQAYPVACLWYCNSNGDIQTYNTGILHMSPMIFDDGTNIGIFNIMRGWLITLPYANARKAYANQLIVLERSIEEMDPALAADIHNTATEVTSGKGLRVLLADLSKQITDLTATVNSIKAGKPAPFEATITPK